MLDIWRAVDVVKLIDEIYAVKNATFSIRFRHHIELRSLHINAHFRHCDLCLLSDRCCVRPTD
jgi:hypothetical protein